MARFRVWWTLALLLVMTVGRGAAGVSANSDASATPPAHCLKAAPTLVSSYICGGNGNPGTAATDVAPPIDLAALVPDPDELGDGFVNGGSQYYPAVYYAARDSDITLDDLANAGFVGTYDAALSLIDPADPLTEIQNVRLVFTQLSGPDGARGYLAGLDMPKDWHAVDGTLPVGDDVTLQEGAATSGGRPYEAIGVRYRVGSIAISLTISDWNHQHPEGGLSRDTDGLTELAKLVNRRLAKVEKGELGGLEPMVLRLGAEDQTYTSTYEAYLMLDGAYVRRYGVSDEDAAKLQERTQGLLDGYQVQQKPGDGNGTGAFNVRIYRFDSEASASDYLDLMRSQITSEPGYTAIDEIDAQPFGDDSAAYAYEMADPDTSGVRITARVGAFVITVGLEDATEPDLGAVEQLMTEQLACVDAGACVDAVALPA